MGNHCRADIAHDLRQFCAGRQQQRQKPWNRLRFKEGRTGTEYERVVERALQDCDAILAVFSALLRISQIESGMRLANFAPVSLPELLHRVVELFAPGGRGQPARGPLRIDLGERLTVHADATLLMQMFSNLLENSIRHAGHGTTIRIECRRVGAEAQVRVIDSGPGIPIEERDKVFDRLYRLERSRNTPGYGLGLPL